MACVTAHMTMSLDGFIATDTDEVGALFDWYDVGPVELASHHPGIRFRLDEPGAQLMRSMMADIGALVCGRRLFDITAGWGDQHPIGAPVVVITHRTPADAARWSHTSFCADVPQAITLAQEIAGEQTVVISSADIVGQALDLGLVDEVAVSLVPLLMGSGKAYFGSLTRGPLLLDDPVVVTGARATQLRYRVRR